MDPNSIASKIASRHIADVEALTKSLSPDAKQAFLNGAVLGGYYTGYLKGICAAAGILAEMQADTPQAS